jgi:hypothetical protein
MEQERAFCPSTAKMSGEHIWSDWMNKVFPRKKRFHNFSEGAPEPKIQP